MAGAARQGSLFAAIVETVGSHEPVARLQKLEVLLGFVGFFALVTVVRTASGSLHGLPMEAAQREEVLLTAAQTVFAVAILVNLCISLREAFALFGLFWAQFILGAVVPPSWKGVELLVLSGVYLALGVWLLARRHGDFRHLLRDGFRTPYEELEPQAAAEGTSRSQVTK